MQALALSLPSWLPEDSIYPLPLSAKRVEEVNPIIMSITVKHQRSKSAPDGKSWLANWDSSLTALKEDSLWSRDQEDGEKTAMSKMPGHVRKDKLISLKRDVEHLEVMLKGQKATKGVLEQALAQASSVLIPRDGGNHLSQYTQSLVKDIALLELEVVQLEQLLLSMYRDAFEVKIKEQSCVSRVLNGEEASSRLSSRSHQLEPPKTAKRNLSSSSKSGSLVSRILNLSSGSRSFDESKAEQKVPRKGKSAASFSQPISFTSKQSKSKGSPSPATYELWREVISAEAKASSNGNETSLGIQSGETPNKLSEELVRCMAAIYCKLADPPISNLGTTISPSSSYSSAISFSSKELLRSSGGWSPQKPNPSGTLTPTSTCQRESSAESTDPYASMVAVPWIHVDNDRLQHAEKMLTNFRSLVHELERLNPGDLKHEEKLAFWLNIYNALMMHAYLAYGIPRSQIKRVSLLQKASYKIGLQSVNAHTIENTILGCRSHRPSQWIQAFLSPVSKLRTLNRQAYALDRPEPLACFALCCGGHSDPPVRVYTAKNVYQELDLAKKEFLRANLILQKDNKILAPKVLESFAKESSIGSSSLLEWICQNLSEKQRREVRACMNMRPHHRCIEWAPYNFSFRYLFVRDLARWFPPMSS